MTACWRSIPARCRPNTGEVQAEGIDLDFIAIDDPRQIFDRMGGRISNSTPAKMSSSEVISRHAAGRRREDGGAAGLPLARLPARLHYGQPQAVRTPKDLAGKRIGHPALHPDRGAVHPRPAAGTSTGSISRACIGSRAPPTERSHTGIRRRRRCSGLCRSSRMRSGRSLSELLEAGEIQAIIGSGLPLALRTNPDVQRLFPDFHARASSTTTGARASSRSCISSPSAETSTRSIRSSPRVSTRR